MPLPELSDKTLTERLTLLVETGVAERQDRRGFPSTVTYCLTPVGQALRPLMTELYKAGETLLEQQSRPGVADSN